MHEVWWSSGVDPEVVAGLRAAGPQVVGARSAAEQTAVLSRSGSARVLLLLPALAVVVELRREADRGAAALVATHDLAVAAVCDRTVRLVAGRLG